MTTEGGGFNNIPKSTNKNLKTAARYTTATLAITFEIVVINSTSESPGFIITLTKNRLDSVW